MTYNLRPLHLRMANGIAETKGYNGAALSPWRTGKSQVKRLVKDSRGTRYTNDDGSANAKGLPPVTKEVDNSGECVGGDYEWTAKDRKAAAEQNKRTLAADGVESAAPWQDVVTEGTAHNYPQKPREELTSLSQGWWYYEEEAPTNYKKDPNYQHGPLHNVPHPDHTCMAWGGWKGQAQAMTYKQGPKLQVMQPLSLEGLAEMAMEEAWETEGDELNTDDLVATYGEHEAYENDAPVETTNHEAVLEWAKQSTKPVSWEACLLWANGKTLAEVGVVQGVSKATAQSRVERTLSRLQTKMHTQH